MAYHIQSHILVVLMQFHELLRDVVSILVIVVSESEAGDLHVDHLELEDKFLGEGVVGAEADRVLPVDSDRASQVEVGVVGAQTFLQKIRHMVLNLCLREGSFVVCQDTRHLETSS